MHNFAHDPTLLKPCRVRSVPRQVPGRPDVDDALRDLEPPHQVARLAQGHAEQGAHPGLRLMLWCLHRITGCLLSCYNRDCVQGTMPLCLARCTARHVQS